MAVRDSRNRRVPGIYTRNGRYYGQLWIKTENTARKFALVDRMVKPLERSAKRRRPTKS